MDYLQNFTILFIQSFYLLEDYLSYFGIRSPGGNSSFNCKYTSNRELKFVYFVYSFPNSKNFHSQRPANADFNTFEIDTCRKLVSSVY